MNVDFKDDKDRTYDNKKILRKLPQGFLGRVLRRYFNPCGGLAEFFRCLAEVLRRSCGGLAEVLRRSLSTLHLESTSIISVLVCHALWFGVCLQKKHKFEGHMNQTLGHLRVKCDF